MKLCLKHSCSLNAVLVIIHLVPRVVSVATNYQHRRFAGNGNQPAFKHNYRKDCGKAYTPVLLQESLPGTGMNAESRVPYQIVLKDGYLFVGCLADRLFEEGDKFGANKMTYKVGDTLNVSIVHYKDAVPAEDRKRMNYDVCFKFCRTIPGINFFGITQGLDCYCTPFYHQVAGDSSECDAVCEGDKGSFCGGKTKASVFAMHWCANTALELSTASEKANALATHAAILGNRADQVATDMQTATADLQKYLSQLGDSAASELMQGALQWAGKLEKAANDALKSASSIKESADSAGDLIGEDFSRPKKASQAEEFVGSLEKSSSAAEAEVETLGSIFNQTTRGLGEGDHNLDSFSPLTKHADLSSSTFVQYMNLSDDSSPSTCSGDWDGKPIFGVSLQDCAAACDKQVSSPACVGFSYYDESLCFLFSKFKAMTVYTGECQTDDHTDDADDAAEEAEAAAAAAEKQKEQEEAAAAAAKKQKEEAKAAAAAAKKKEEQEKAAAAAAQKQKEEAEAAAAAAEKQEEEAKALAASAKTEEEKKAAAAAAAAAKKKEDEAKAAAEAAAAAKQKEEEAEAAAAAAKKKEEEEAAAAAAAKKKAEEEEAEAEAAAAAAAKKEEEEKAAAKEEVAPDNFDYDNMDFGDDADFADVADCDESHDTDCDGIMNEDETPESIAEDKKQDAALAKKEAEDGKKSFEELCQEVPRRQREEGQKSKEKVYDEVLALVEEKTMLEARQKDMQEEKEKP